MPDTIQRRRVLVNSVMERIGEISAVGVPDRSVLSLLRDELLKLAAHPELFDQADFPPPADPSRSSNMFVLHRCGDGGPTLYVSIAPAGLATPVHFHSTWAIIVGLRGEELNRFYERDSSGHPVETGSFVVCRGTAITMLPDDLHSIRILETPERFFSFHLYGRPFEMSTDRMFYSETAREWTYFAHRPMIRTFDLERGVAVD